MRHALPDIAAPFSLPIARDTEAAAQDRPRKGKTLVAWIRSEGLVDYDAALAWMQERAKAIAAGTADEAIWLLEHPPLYTAGTSAKRDDLKDPDRFPVFETRRGGQYT